MPVCIFSTVNQLDAGLLKSALDEKNIDNYLKNFHSNTLGLAGWTTPFAGINLLSGNIEVFVKEEDVEKALEIVKLLFENTSDEESTEDETASFVDDELKSSNDNNITDKKNIEEQAETVNPSIRKRHSFTTFYLYFSLVASIYTGIKFLWDNLMYLRYGYYNIFFYLLNLIPSVIGVLAVIYLLKWRNKGVWMYLGAKIFAIIFPVTFRLLDVNIVRNALIHLIGILVMFAVLFIRKDGKNTWVQLD